MYFKKGLPNQLFSAVFKQISDYSCFNKYRADINKLNLIDKYLRILIVRPKVFGNFRIQIICVSIQPWWLSGVISPVSNSSRDRQLGPGFESPSRHYIIVFVWSHLDGGKVKTKNNGKVPSKTL